jgi:predicted CoA-binding protein
VKPTDIFNGVSTVLVIDWPSREVPEMLALAGFQVVVKGGPGARDYAVHEVVNGTVVVRRGVEAPERVDLIYAHRPMAELAGIIESALALHAKAIWTQSGLAASGVKDTTGYWVPDEELKMARHLVQAAGLQYLAEPYICDVVRQLRKDE